MGRYLDQLTKGVNRSLLHSFLPPRAGDDPKLVRRAVCKLRTYQSLWNSLLDQIKTQLCDYIPQIPHQSTSMAVIVEPRKHPDLFPVLLSYMYHLNRHGPSWGLQIFHGTDNEEWLKNMLHMWPNVIYTNLQVSNLQVSDYSRLLKNTEFWNKIPAPAEHILIFQTDSIMLRSGIDAFLAYDYIGAPWKVSKEHEYVIGNGGLSLRKKSIMLQICVKYPDTSSRPEDVYFADHLLHDGYQLPTKEIAMTFSVETIYHDRPLGVHKPLRIPLLKLKDLLQFRS